MATRLQSVFLYSSTYASREYQYEVVLDVGGVHVRNIRTPYGRIHDSMTGLPEAVVDDIQLSMDEVEGLLAQSSALNGTVVFADEDTKTVNLASSLTAATYRVFLDIPEFISYKILSKTATSFQIVLSANFTGTLSYDVIV